MRLSVLVSLVLLCACHAHPGQSAPAGVSLGARHELSLVSKRFVLATCDLGAIEGDAIHESLRVDMASRTLAYLRRRGDRVLVQIGSTTSQEWSRVLHLLPIGNGLFAYAAVDPEDHLTYVVVGRTKKGPYQWISNLVVGPRSETVAFVATDVQGRRVLVSDGETKLDCDGVAAIARAASGRHMAFIVRRKDTWNVVHRNRELDLGYSVLGSSIALSQDGESIAFHGAGDDGERAFLNGHGESAHGAIGLLRISSTGSQIAYAAQEVGDRTWAVYAGGTRIADGFDSIGELQFVGEPPIIAFQGRRNEARRVFLGTKEVWASAYVENLAVSPDGASWAVVEVQGDSERSQQYRVVVNGVAGEIWDWATDILLLSKGQVGYTVRRNGKYSVVVGDSRSEDFDEVWSPVSTLSDKLVYLLLRKDHAYLGSVPR